MSQRILVMNNKGNYLNPCSRGKARRLIRENLAVKLIVKGKEVIVLKYKVSAAGAV